MLTHLLVTMSVLGYCQTWMPLDEGVSWEGGAGSTVYGILGDTDNHVLYVTGYFDTAGNVYAYRCAKWDGTAWSDMSTLDEGSGQFLIFNGELYKAGYQVERWNGSSWNFVDPYFDDVLGYLIEYDGQLLAGGTFTETGAVLADGLAFLDTDDHWQPFPGGGVISEGAYGGGAYIGTMAIYNGDLIVAGNFDSAGGVACKNIARWDGSQWHPLGSGVTYTGPTENVRALGVYKDTLYVAGSFDTVGGIYCLDFAKWDGNQWYAVDNPTNFFPKSFKVYNGFLYAGGTSIGNGNKIKRFDGQTWSNLVDFLSGSVFSIDIFEGILYAGGSFIIYTPNDTINDIAMLDMATGEWKPMPTNEGLSIFPNPAIDEVTVQMDPKPYFQQLNIINALGTTVITKQLTGKHQETIKVNNLPPGVYFMKFENGEVRKFVRQ